MAKTARAKARTLRAKARASKDAKNESSKKAKNDDQRKCFYCLKAECRKRLKDLADAEEKPMAATPHHPNETAAVVPLQCLLPCERHTSTFVMAMPCGNSETSCESSSEQAVRSPGAGSIAPAETTLVIPIAAIPSNETYLMMDTCAGASIFRRGFDQSATDDSTVALVRLSTATDDPVHGDAGKKSCFGLRDGRKFQVRYNEADVSFPMGSIGEASQQQQIRVWSGLSSGVARLKWKIPQVMCEGPKCGKVGETPRSVLVAMFCDGAHGRGTVVPESQDRKVSC